MITKQQIDQAKKPSGDVGRATVERMNNSHDQLTNWAMNFLEKDQVERALDVGCGGGATVGRLMEKYPNAFVDGVDYAQTSVDCSREFHGEALGKTCQIVQGDVHNLPYESHCFDLVTAFETVYFWADLPRALGEVRRVLKAEGNFLMCCEMSDPTNERWKNVLGEMTIHTAKGWKTILEEHGFVIEVCQTQREWVCLIARVYESA